MSTGYSAFQNRWENRSRCHLYRYSTLQIACVLGIQPSKSSTELDRFPRYPPALIYYYRHSFVHCARARSPRVHTVCFRHAGQSDLAMNAMRRLTRNFSSADGILLYFDNRNKGEERMKNLAANFSMRFLTEKRCEISLGSCCILFRDSV